MSDLHPIAKKPASLALRVIEALEAIDEPGSLDDPYVSEVVIGWYGDPAARIVPNEFGGFDLEQVSARVPSIRLEEAFVRVDLEGPGE